MPRVILERSDRISWHNIKNKSPHVKCISIRTRMLAIPPYFVISSQKWPHWLNLAHALTGEPDFPFGSNSGIASHFPPCCLAPTDNSLKAMKNITYSHQSISYGDILSSFVQFVNRFDKKTQKRSARALLVVKIYNYGAGVTFEYITTQPK